MSRFLEALHSGRVLLMDGAMGTELLRAGLDPERERCEQWNLSHPEKVVAVHRAYGDAGATVYVTNTFQSQVGFYRQPRSEPLEDVLRQWREECRAGVLRAREGGGNVRMILGSVGPMVQIDLGAYVSGAVIDLLSLDADAVLLETQPSLFEAGLVLDTRELPESRMQLSGGAPVGGKPLLISFAFRLGLHGQATLPDAKSAEVVADWAVKERPEIVALGVNCGRDIGIDEILDIVRRYRRVTDLPLFVCPNAGTPTRTANGWEYPLTPEKLASRLPELLEAGIAMFGGCCGTTPAHIAACRPIIDEWNRKHAPVAEG